MNITAEKVKTEEQECCLKMDLVPIVGSMFNKTTAYDAYLTLYGNGLNAVPYKTIRPVAERTDIYVLLEQWALGKCCKLVSDLIQDDTKFDYVTLNISARYLKTDKFVHDLLKITGKAGIPHEKICLEISEDDLEADTEMIIGKLHELKKEGFLIAIDDYNGYNIPLSRLDSIPSDIIKIDKSVTDNIQTDRKAEQTVRSIVGRAGDLSREVIAKSVDSEKNKYMLIALGCEKIQGYTGQKN